MMSDIHTSSQCWNCQADKDPSGAFCPLCGARLKETRNPSPPDHALDMAFLYDLYCFGWHNRHVQAVALYEAMANIGRLYQPAEVQEHFRLEIDPPSAQATLRAKILAEYVAQLEAFGVLCVAILKRQQQSILWTYLHTQPQEVTQFYDRVRSMGPKSLQHLLELPRLSEVRKAYAAKANASIPIAGLEGDVPHLDIAHVVYDYREHSQTIVNIAKVYLESEDVPIYNKIKHVFPMIKDLGQPFASLNPAEYIAFAIDDKGTTARLPMKSEEVEAEVDRIHLTMTTGLELIALCLSLYQLNML